MKQRSAKQVPSVIKSLKLISKVKAKNVTLVEYAIYLHAATLFTRRVKVYHIIH